MPKNFAESITKTNDIQACFQRLYEVTDCHTQSELAEFLGVKQSSVSIAKKCSEIPEKWLLKLLFLLNINPAWLLHGNEAKYLYPKQDNK